MKKYQDLGQWKERLARCKDDRADKVEDTWKIIGEQYKDVYASGDEDIHVNMAFPTIRVLLQAACAREPYVYINSVNPWHQSSAEVLQFLENRLWRSQNRKKIMRLIVLDALLMKVGYALTHINPNPDTGVPEVTLSRVSPRDLWLEPGAKSIDEAYYIFRRVSLSREEAKKLWPKVELENLNHNFEDIHTVDDDILGRVEVYELHDQLHREISVFAPGCDKYLRPPRKSPYPIKSLFTELVFNEIIDEHYGISDLEPVIMQQEEMNRLRTAMMTHTKRFKRKYKLQKQSVRPEGLDALESGEDGAVVEMDDIDGLQPITDAPMPHDNYVYQGMIQADHREITGINEYLRAGQVGGNKTAYEAEQIMSGAKLRLGEKVDIVGDFAEGIAFKDIILMKTLYPAPQVAKLYGPEGQDIWRVIQKDDLQGEHYVKIHFGSMRPKDESADFQRAMLLLQVFGQDPQIDHRGLLEVVMKLMNLKDRDKLLPKKSGGQGQPQGQSNQGMNPKTTPEAMMQMVGRGGINR